MTESQAGPYVKHLGFEQFRQTRRHPATPNGLHGVGPAQDSEEIDHAVGALYGAVIGGSLGALTQAVSPAEIIAGHPELGNGSAYSARKFAASDLIGDTLTGEASLLLRVAQLVDSGGHLRGHALASVLTDPTFEATALHDPYLRQAAKDLKRGADSPRIDRWGDTDGGAVLALPLGIALPRSPLSRLMGRVEEACRLTHDSGRAIAGAGALAGAISAALTGATLIEALAFGRQAAETSEQWFHGHYAPGASVAERIDWSLQLVGSSDTARARGLISTLVGTGSQVQEAIPAAFALALLWPDDPWRVCLEAARVGGDSATIGLLAGSIAGAAASVEAFPCDVLARVDLVSSDSLQSLAQRLISRRRGARGRRAGRRAQEAPSDRPHSRTSRQP